MPKGFTDKEFLCEFKLLYSYLWDDVCAKAKEYRRMDNGLEKKGFPKRYFFPTPAMYIKKVSTWSTTHSFYFSLSLKRRGYHSTKNYFKREQINKTEKGTVFRKYFLEGL